MTLRHVTMEIKLSVNRLRRDAVWIYIIYVGHDRPKVP